MSQSIKDRTSTIMRMAGNIAAGTTNSLVRGDMPDAEIERIAVNATRLARAILQIVDVEAAPVPPATEEQK